MKTEIIEVDEFNIDDQAMEECAEIIRGGELVGFPTETVYGLGADGLNSDGIIKIFKAKGRPQDNPLILHISEEEELDRLVEEIPENARICMENFWPGPLTIIFKKSDLIPDEITAGLNTVGIRMPDNKIARELIRRSKTPIAAPSANTSGKPSPTKASHVYMDLKGKISRIIDGGDTGLGLESTVLDLTGEKPMILRPGGITLEDLKEVLGEVEVDKGILNINEKIIPKSPGQKYKHYAPEAEMYIYEGDNDLVRERISLDAKKYIMDGKKVGIMCAEENKDFYGEGYIISLGGIEDKDKIAQNLFHSLREFDSENMDIILAEAVEYSQLGMAIMNRMSKAASGRIIRVQER